MTRMNPTFDRPMPARIPASASRARTMGVRLAPMLAVALPLALVMPGVHAEQADRDKPLNIEADNMTYDDLKQLTIFTGHVVATKGTILIRADRVDVKQDPQGYQHASGTSNGSTLSYFRQKRDSVDEYIEGNAVRIDYDGKQDLTTLTTRAVVRRLRGLSNIVDEVRGSVITYDGQKDVYTAQSGKDVAGPGNPSGRVRAMLTPGASGGTAPQPSGEVTLTPNATAMSASVLEVPAPAAASTLSVRNLRKRYGARTIIKDVSLDVKSGEVVGLLGPNGAGKTTSFYIIVGLVPLDAGEITLDDTSISLLPIHKRARMGLSYLPQEASVFRKLTVNENIRAVLELQRDEHDKPLPKQAVSARADALLEELQIAHLRDNPAMSLSGGERRRVEIARALATRPSFILLDEPFAGVDPIAVLEIQKIVRFLKERGIGVLITDHNVRETLGICDHAYIISDGSVLAAGAPKEIISNESVRRVYLGEHFRM
ncbi:hypothetical protein DFQ28_000551 [Apophysomyces sp. BC1034]|nr:hypothetical protein DFQ28_000551 [Apophysomyces sp. BC1034]